MKNFKVLYVINSLGWGGAETQIKLIITGMLDLGLDVTLVILHSCDDRFITEMHNIGVAKLYNLGMTRGIPNPFYILKLRKIIKNEKPNIIHSHIAQANIVTRLANFNKYPLISTAHNFKEGGWLIDKLYQLTDGLCNITTNVSQEAVDRYNSDGLVKSKRCILVLNGVDCQRFEKLSVFNEVQTTEFQFIAVGRVAEQKNYPLLIEAMKYTDCKLKIVAAGDTSPLVQLVNEYGLAKRVTFLEPTPLIEQYYAQANAFVMSSHWEGLPMVILEAMSSGLPIVSTEVGDVPGIVNLSKAGAICRNPEPQDFANVMNKMAKNDSIVLERMAINGREYVTQNYSINNVCNIWLEFYESLAVKENS